MREDQRIGLLAESILKKSVELKAGERIYIEARGASTLPFFNTLIAEATKVGAIPFYSFNGTTQYKQFVLNATEEQIMEKARFDNEIMSTCSVYVGVTGEDDIFEASDIPDEKMNLYQKHYFAPVHSQNRVPNTRWCVMRYPTYALAALSKMSLKDFEDFYFNSCLLDYRKMSEAMTPLVELMERTDKVKIVAPNTNLEFSIKGLGAVKCDGHRNIPDGEVYTAPVRDSINGYVQFNTETSYQGTVFSNIYLKFENGCAVEGRSSSNNEKFQDIINIDEGARYVGEFALGVNPHIKRPILNILFDEKISGSFHMAIGNSYNNASFNGNTSAIHWDLIQIQTEDMGGGEIYFDDVLIRKNGVFVLEELKGLNPENLI